MQALPGLGDMCVVQFTVCTSRFSNGNLEIWYQQLVAVAMDQLVTIY